MEDFTAVYIDDILIYSQTEGDHAEHLKRVLQVCEKEGLELSPTKMKIATPEVEFLGAVLGNGKIQLQPDIIKRIVEFDEQQLKEKKGLRSWLGILNYARAYIPTLGVKLGPLYQKTSPHGDKRLKECDMKIIRQLKQDIQRLPNLELPSEEAYLVIETDGCMEGWGGICKWKKMRNDSKSTEKIRAVHGDSVHFAVLMAE